MENQQTPNLRTAEGCAFWYWRPAWFSLERLLDGIPGLTVWAALIFCIVTAIFIPETLLLIAALLALYSGLRFLLAGLANAQGLRHISSAESADWRARYKIIAGKTAIPWEQVQHVVIIPNYNEPIEVLAKSLENIAHAPEAARQITVVLAMEGHEAGCVDKAEQLQAAYAEHFARFYYTVHPADLPGEMQCKSANLAWAGRWIKCRLVDEEGVNIEDIVVTSMDADTLWHQRYFTALTYYFATDPDRHSRFWQAPIRYHSNIYQVNPLIRLVNAYSTAIELAYLAADWWASMPISSYSLSMKLLEDSGYWDTDVISDEWHMYIKAFFVRRTRLSLMPIYLPFLASSVTGKDFWDLCKNRYQQSLRHAWGSKEIGYTVGNILKFPDLIPVRLLRLLRLLLSVTHDLMLSGAGWVILLLGANLPLLLHPSLLATVFREHLSYPPVLILQIAFTLFFVLGIVFYVLDVSVRPPRPSPATIPEGLLTTLGFLALPLLLAAFVTVPILHAQAWLLSGTPLAFRVSSKV